MSLAALLKADLEDLDDEQEEFENEDQKNQVSFSFKPESYEIEDVGMSDEAEYKTSMDTKENQFTKESVRNIAKLLDSQQLMRIVEKIEMYQNSGSANRGESWTCRTGSRV